jgi:hypothetical protein
VDANGNTRAVQTWERVILDQFVAGTTDGSTAWYAELVDTGAAAGNTVIALLSVSIPSVEIPGEGLSFSVGTTPAVTGNDGSTIVTATGRIINGKSQGVRAGYKELLTPGGNNNGQ